MMPLISGVMLAVSSSLAASIVAKATVTAALALIATWLARGNRAALRHALLAAAFGVLLVLPIATIIAPPVLIAVPEATQPRNAATRAGATIVPGPSAKASISKASELPPSATLSPSALSFTAWIAGVAFFLLPVVNGLWQVRSLRRSALPWPRGQSVAETLAVEAGIHRRVEVFLHESLRGPMTYGIVHPAIVLSPDAQTWETEDLDRAIVHELEHVRRGDWASHCLARAVCAVYWFHPLVWMAWRQLALEAERSCDDAVLRRSDAAAYADQLVGLARRLSSAAKSPVLAMANRADLATRVAAVLDLRQPRGRAGRLPVALACAAAAVLVLTVAPLTVVTAQQSAGTEVRAISAPQYSSTTSLVIEAVEVSDKNGQTVEGLNANDFVATEDGVAQVINVFEFQKVPPTPAQNSISSYYILGYYGRNQDLDGRFRRLKITLKEDTTAHVRYRPGYYADKSFRGIGNAAVGRNIAPDSVSPALITKREAAYSEEARKAKFQGFVILSVEINPSGEVTDPKVVRSLGLGLDQKAIEAVMQWKFKPAVKDGKPVATQAEVTVNFRLL